MFIGHFAVAFAAKKVAPRTSLGTLLAAALFIDLLWPLFLLAGIEQVEIDPGNTAFTPLAFVHYPWSHSLLMTGAWAAGFGLIYFAARRYSPGAIVAAFLVLSHWLLDAVVHRPDLPLLPDERDMIGLGMWNSIGLTFAVECAMFAVGLGIYLAATRARDATGRYACAGFVAVTLAIYAGNVLGPPPPDTHALAWVALAAWLFPLWAAWFDRHRAAVDAPPGASG